MRLVAPPPGARPRTVTLTADELAGLVGATEARQWRRDLHDTQVFITGALLGVLAFSFAASRRR